MGRPKKVLAQASSYHELAQWLRSLRERSGLTYRQIAARTGEPGCSPSTLSRADSGATLPRLSVVESYATACGASAREACAMWERAAYATRAGDQTVPPRTRRRERRLELVHEPAHVLEAMVNLRRAAGNPSLRELQERARINGFGPLPRSSVADVLAGLRLPSEALLISYALSCGVPQSQTTQWRAAWHRAAAARGSRLPQESS